MKLQKLINFIFRAVALGLSVASLVLVILKQDSSKSIMLLMALGMVCLSISVIQDRQQMK